MENALIKIEGVELAPEAGWKVRDNSDGMITRMRVEFPNGYEASIVRGLGTYGSDDGLFEGAVMHGKEGIVHDTPVAPGDVKGWMSAQEAIQFIKDVAALPERK